MARIAKPQVGKDARHFANRSAEMLAAIDIALDQASSASAIRNGESHAEWIGRIGPLCLEVEDGESLDDVFPKLAGIAERPPFEGRKYNGMVAARSASDRCNECAKPGAWFGGILKPHAFRSAGRKLEFQVNALRQSPVSIQFYIMAVI